MNEILATILGVILYIAMMWILLAVMRLEKTRPEDDDEQERAVSKPAPLTKHVRANTAYGEPLQ